MFKVKLLASAQKIFLIYPKQLEHAIMRIVFNSIGVEMPGVVFLVILMKFETLSGGHLPAFGILLSFKGANIKLGKELHMHLFIAF